jgi:hypothetical protein
MRKRYPCSAYEGEPISAGSLGTLIRFTATIGSGPKRGKPPITPIA